mmetsp:Transcript_51832/g.46529  ORF Transcript_51832/g.46529 Transcript_51832/m.46529 type:complete len:129 (-) Transcript_51832:131-517(-)
MGSCGTKIPKEHSYTQPKSTNSNHKILEEISDDEGENLTHQYHHSSHPNSSRENLCNDGSNKSKSDGIATMNRTVASNNSTNSVHTIQSPTYQKLREMGFDSKLAREASDKHPINVNDAMEYAWTKQN